MLQVANIGKRYGENIILADVSFILNPRDRLGLIGPNGCGKTTLLRIIAGCEQPDRGSLEVNPPDQALGYLEQGLTYAPGETVGEALYLRQGELEAAEQRLAGLATALATTSEAEQQGLATAYSEALAEVERLAARQTAAHEVATVLAGLGLAGLPLETPVAILSGGQKTRLGLARLLVERPQILLLDEPTNHLDIEALEWLEAWLARYPGAALIVSHDRAFLDRTVTGILELDPLTHTIREFAGNYGDYVAQKQAELERQWQAYTDQNQEVARLRLAAQQMRSQGSPHKGGKGSDGDKFAKGFFANRGHYAVRKAKHIEARIERLLTEERIEKPKPTWQMKLDFADTPETGQDVIILQDLAVGYGGVPLLRGVSQVLRAGERVALVGPNGSGKTTLLRAITGALKPLAGRVRLGPSVRLGYYSQEQEGLDAASTPYETIAAVAVLPQTEIRAFLHRFLFSGDDVFVPVGSLSYGERARLVLARLVASGCNCLLLDEPINHLDIASRAAFERAMAAFTGTVLAVVHDRYFIRQFARRIWAVEGGTVKGYVDLEQWSVGRTSSAKREA